MNTQRSVRVYEVRPRKDHRGVDYAKFRSRSPDAVIRVCDEPGNVTEAHEHAGEFKEP
jgi:hypothetical protein